jgi:hypothetical protein
MKYKIKYILIYRINQLNLDHFDLNQFRAVKFKSERSFFMKQNKFILNKNSYIELKK